MGMMEFLLFLIERLGLLVASIFSKEEVPKVGAFEDGGVYK